jgi:hypothetical protein
MVLLKARLLKHPLTCLSGLERLSEIASTKVKDLISTYCGLQIYRILLTIY